MGGADNVVALIVALLIAVYLVLALVFPERF
jgi:K+-transporting ATPase KdpF subunit